MSERGASDIERLWIWMTSPSIDFESTVWTEYDGNSTERNSNELIGIFHLRFHHIRVILYLEIHNSISESLYVGSDCFRHWFKKMACFWTDLNSNHWNANIWSVYSNSILRGRQRCQQYPSSMVTCKASNLPVVYPVEFFDDEFGNTTEIFKHFIVWF